MKKLNKQFEVISGASIVCLSFVILSLVVFTALYSYAAQDSHNYFFALMMSYSFVASLRFCLYMAGAFGYSIQNKKSDSFIIGVEPFVSVILPAYNEALVVEASLKNFENISYSNFEVILVDDGSFDDTYVRANALVDQVSFPLRVYKKANGGKADALNFGVSESSADFVLCMDADSILSKDSIRNGILKFQKDDRLAAVGGTVHVLRGRGGLIESLQQLDYLVGHFQKKILSIFGKVSIVPGPIGLFRKNALLEVGGYETEDETFAEDAEITLRLIAHEWKVICSDEMKAYTEVPHNYPALLQQRYRWSRGIYRALLKNLNNVAVLKNESNIFLVMYLLWELIIIPIVNVAILFSFLALFLMGQSLVEYSVPFVYVLCLDLLIIAMATKNEGRALKWLCVSLVSRFFYANILLVWNFLCLVEEWRSVKMTWDKLERTGLLVKENKGEAA